jgi:4-hydroxythreonine-4-phosphate dehydrogenase
MIGPTPLVVTPGEPAGIGPECALRLAAEHPELDLVFVADPALLRRAANRLGLELHINDWLPGQRLSAGVIHCLAVPLGREEQAGRLDPVNGPYVLETLRTAVDLVQRGFASALVTGPVHKGVINDAGIPFTGHTEFLAALGGVERVVMMLAAGSLRVALATTHLPLRAVPGAITPEVLDSTLRVIDHTLKGRFGIERPRIQVLGLNPHAGEGGHLGHEDDAIIRPAIVRSANHGIAAFGPVPADTAFTPPALEACDVVLAMYHDQGLPVLKHAGFGRAVNIPLGLPFIRTSVDHGTALDIAGQGRANAESFWHAACTALDMCRGRSQ